MNNKKRRVFAAVLAILLALAMVLPLMLQAVQAETLIRTGKEVLGTSTSQTGEALAAVSGSSESQSRPGEKQEPQVPDGAEGAVYIENINISGLSESEVQKAVDSKLADLSSDRITLRAGQNSAEVEAGAMGLTYANSDIAREAYSIGRSGNILRRFRAYNHLTRHGDIVLDLKLRVSEGGATKAVQSVLATLNCDPKKNGLKRKKDGSFVVTANKEGAKVNLDPSISRLEKYMNSEWHGGAGAVTLDAAITNARDTSDQLANVKDVIGEGKTVYNLADPGRNTNMELAVRLINGSVIYPGDDFDFFQVVGDTTKERGFQLAPSFDATSVTETYGGGVCQVSTTLYRAVLAAELTVKERHPHSMLVGYADPGLDAAVATDALDFSFENSTDTPIYIEGTMENGELDFRIYGLETRDSSRTVSYSGKITESIEFETVYRLDDSVPYGQILTSGGSNGYEAEACKTITVDGVVETEEIFNQGKYSPAPLVYRVGTQGASDAAVAALSRAVQAESLDEINAVIYSGSYI